MSDDSSGRTVARFADSLAGRAVMEGILRYFEARFEGRDHVPRRGGALLVANHGMNGHDGVVLGALLHRETGRLPYWLGEKNLWRIPLFDRLARFIDAVPGEPESAVSLLRRGEIVVVYPGGIDDSFKLSSERHKLQWGRRSGFAKVALAAGVPVVPVAALGVDDMFTVLARERWIGRALFGSRKYDLPIAYGRWGTPVPRPVPVTIRALSPVPPEGDATDPEAVERMRSRVWEAVQRALDDGA